MSLPYRAKDSDSPSVTIMRLLATMCKVSQRNFPEFFWWLVVALDGGVRSGLLPAATGTPPGGVCVASAWPPAARSRRHRVYLVGSRGPWERISMRPGTTKDSTRSPWPGFTPTSQPPAAACLLAASGRCAGSFRRDLRGYRSPASFLPPYLVPVVFALWPESVHRALAAECLRSWQHRAYEPIRY